MKVFKNKEAFTLVELVTVIAIMSIVLTMVYQTYTSNLNILPKASTKSFLQQDVRFTSEYITKEIRYARSLTVYATKPASFNPNLIYIYSENNNIKYVKNGTEKNILTDDPNRTLNLLFSHSNEDTNTIIFTINGEAKTTYSLETKVEILNLNGNPIVGMNGYYIAYSLTDFSNNAPTVTSTNPLTVDSYTIHHYSLTDVSTPVNSINITGSVPYPFSVVSFFDDADLSSGDFLTYFTTSELPDIISVSIDSNNKLQFTIKSTVTTDTPVKISLSAVDDYGAAASAYFLVTVKAGSVVTPSTISSSGSSDTEVFYKNTGYQKLDLTSYFTYTGGASPEYTATKNASNFDYNNISTDTSGSYKINVTATINKGDPVNEVSVTREITLDIRTISIVVKKDDGVQSGNIINLDKKYSFKLQIFGIDDSTGDRVKIYCSPENDFGSYYFSGTYEPNENLYNLTTSSNGKSDMTISVYLFGYSDNSITRYEKKTIRVTCYN